MLTLKHFFDRPTWAAAGYEFNFIDCMSEAANRVDIFKGIFGVIKEIPDIELREIWKLPFSVFVCILAILWPFIYPLVAIRTYFSCKRVAKQYRDGMPEIVKNNISVWIRDFKEN